MFGHAGVIKLSIIVIWRAKYKISCLKFSEIFHELIKPLVSWVRLLRGTGMQGWSLKVLGFIFLFDSDIKDIKVVWKKNFLYSQFKFLRRDFENSRPSTTSNNSKTTGIIDSVHFFLFDYVSNMEQKLGKGHFVILWSLILSINRGYTIYSILNFVSWARRWACWGRCLEVQGWSLRKKFSGV